LVQAVEMRAILAEREVDAETTFLFARVLVDRCEVAYLRDARELLLEAEDRPWTTTS